MKNTLSYLMIWIVIYLIFSLISWKINMSQWDELGRGFYVAFSLFISLINYIRINGKL